MKQQQQTTAVPTGVSIRSRIMLSLAAVVLASCGFRMQGETPLPFKTMSITIPENTQFGADIRRAIKASSPNTQIIELDDLNKAFQDLDKNDAQAVASANLSKVSLLSTSTEAQLQQVSEIRNARAVSLNAQGKVEEFELTLQYTIRLIDSKGQVILPDTTFTAVRQMPYDDRFAQAFATEQATMFKDMQKGLVSRIMRRITSQDVTERARNLVRTGTPEKNDVPAQVVAPSLSNEPVVPEQLRMPSLMPSPVISQ